jgi:hypothetical protein
MNMSVKKVYVALAAAVTVAVALVGYGVSSRKAVKPCKSTASDVKISVKTPKAVEPTAPDVKVAVKTPKVAEPKASRKPKKRQTADERAAQEAAEFLRKPQ